MTPSEYAAWYGAVIATLTLGLNLFKWFHERPYKVSVVVTKNQKIIPPVETDNPTYIGVKVINRGGRSTTITNVGFMYYQSCIDLLRKKPKTTAIIKYPGYISGQAIPYVLEPGKIWFGNARQEELQNMLDDGILIWEIYFAHTDKPIRIRLK